MSAIIEPVQARWNIPSGDMPDAFKVYAFAARPETHIVVETIGGDSLRLTIAEVGDLESALLNARLWITRAIAQHNELAAVEEVGQGVLCDCDHPIHPGAVCDICDCSPVTMMVLRP